ncbi:MAG TPA: D-alanyl-D-alanine carboxypeptidase, partial [Solirubrobacteraceae bacterium]|nr:D-alanyl-D-alanine carboxypeptidase [Solirubrobacteraceae bacterium]
MFRPNVTRLGALLALVVALACPPAATAQQDGPATPLRDRLIALMGPAGAASGAYVAQVGTGAEVFASRADVPRIPASVQKLYTTSAALRRFGPDDRLLTTVVGTGTIDGDG